MSEPPPTERTPAESSDAAPVAESLVTEKELSLPGWVPPAIGLVLVALGAMAVYTGFKPRMRPQDRIVITEQPSAGKLSTSEDSGGAPGAPEPGASRVVPGESGETIPEPAPLPGGNLPRVTITGDTAGVVQTTRLTVRRGVVFAIDPPDATIYVNEIPIGTANQFGAKDQPYEFPSEGAYDIRIVAPGRLEVGVVAEVSQGAPDAVAVIEAKLATRSR